MLYPKNKQETLSADAFMHPSAEYRGTPFWAWNTKVTPELVTEQIDIFNRMGFGGYHIHPRTGMATPYMGEEYMALVKLAESHGAAQGMLTWLYDEDRYPSGAAGGIVTEDVRFRARHMLLSVDSAKEGFLDSKEAFLAAFAAGEKPRGYYLTSWDVALKDGFLADYRRVPRDCTDAKGRLWHGYMEFMAESPWYNNQTYLDNMNKKAVQRFIEVTHEVYARELEDKFGKTIPAIFTDEPHVKGRQTHPFSETTRDVQATYTDDFSKTYEAAHGYDILNVFPELLWELPKGAVSPHRWRYHDHLCERFASAFADTLGEWCHAHHIALTGHLLSERSLYSQTLALGEAMRIYRAFQLPGIDILADQKELSTAKQTTSVARQFGREGVLSELYGVTHWDFDFKGHKLQGDWQAALGVTIRVPHLAFMSMEGEAKRDWPASISYQSPWYEKYSYVENHFARLNTALTRGIAHCRIAVIHPIESFWLAFGPNDKTQMLRNQMDENFENLMQWLLYGLMDFDFISESMLPSLCPHGGAPLKVGEMAYDAVLVPDCRTLRSTTLERLEAFQAAGGTLLFAGGIPRLENAVPSDRAATLSEKTLTVPYTRQGILDALFPMRELSAVTALGHPAANLFHQIRQDGNARFLFLCHVNRSHRLAAETYHVRLRGRFAVTLYDTIAGGIRPIPAETTAEETLLTLVMHAEDSVLLRLDPISALQGAAPAVYIQPPLPACAARVISAPEGYRLSEPNALLLDYARGALDDEPLGEREEILRLDNGIRTRLGWPLRQDKLIQPWRLPPEPVRHRVRLEYSFQSEIEADGCFLAIERPEEARLSFNGRPLGADIGYYVDKSLRMVALPKILKGENRLWAEMPYARRSHLETLYILGDFGVEAYPRPRLIPRPSRLAFGDVTRQGLPFYTGNVLYDFTLTMEKAGPVTLAVPHFAAPVLEVLADGESQGLIAYAPHQLLIPQLSSGVHTLTLIAYGNRFNGFGTLHNCDPAYKWYGPDSYRTTGDQWSEGYGLHPAGVLSRLEIYIG